MKRNLILLLLIVFQFSCKKGTEKIQINKEEKNLEIDTLTKLLERAKETDTLEIINLEPYWFIKSGKLFAKNAKSAFIVNCPTDSTYRVRFFTENNGKWIKNDELENLEFFPIQNEVLMADYNFDGFLDFYLNSSSSQGISLSRGHLLTINPSTRKIENHFETRNLANMFPNRKTMTIYADSIEYNLKGKAVWKLKYQWENGKLKSTNQKIRTEIE